MAVRPILQHKIEAEDSLLRKVSLPVPQELFGTPELTQILTDMIDTLDAQLDGVAIAAPQIGVSYRIFVVRHDRALPAPLEGEAVPPADIGVFINPKFIKASRRRVEMDEGCLSVRGLYGTTLRHERATVRAQTADGKIFERGGGGLLAQIYQHETDHLDGMLFIDHALELRQPESAEADSEK
jgi:peptide deformylase